MSGEQSDVPTVREVVNRVRQMDIPEEEQESAMQALNDVATIGWIASTLEEAPDDLEGEERVNYVREKAEELDV